MPEMVEEILQRAAETAVIIRCAEHYNISFIHSRLQGREFRRVVSGVRIIKRQRLGLKIEHIHEAAVGPHFFCGVVEHDARDRFSMQTADDGEDVKLWFSHEGTVTVLAAMSSRR